MNPAYILSTNYEKLYSLIEAGCGEVLGFATIRYHENQVVSIHKSGGGNINISEPHSAGAYVSESLDVFVRNCTRLQLKYIVPNAGWKKYPEFKPETPHRYCLLKLDGEGDDDFRFYWDGEKFHGLKSRCLAFLEIPEFKPE